jgi:hypothetical protein
MSIVSKTYTFSTGATIFASEHNVNFDTLYNDYNGNIDNTNIAASAAIVDTKFAQIHTAGKVHGTSFTGLASISSGAGLIPTDNIPTVPTDIGGTGANMGTATQGSVPYFSSIGTMSALACGTSGYVLMATGATSNPVFARGVPSSTFATLFTSNGTFISSAETTKIFVTGSGAGGGGGGGYGASGGGGGGAGGGFCYRIPLTILASTGYAVIIGVGGSGGTGGQNNVTNDGTNGGLSSIANAGTTLTLAGGPKGTGGKNAPGVAGIGTGVGKAALLTIPGGIEVIAGGDGGAPATSGGGGGGTNAGMGGIGRPQTAPGDPGTGYGSGGGGGGGLGGVSSDGGVGAGGYILVEW